MKTSVLIALCVSLLAPAAFAQRSKTNTKNSGKETSGKTEREKSDKKDARSSVEPSGNLNRNYPDRRGRSSDNTVNDRPTNGTGTSTNGNSTGGSMNNMGR